MKYYFYPGCSMHGTALEYRTATLAVLKAVGADIKEIHDWTCCGASVASVMSDLLGLVLPARNLALAEQDGEARDVFTGCSSCFTNLQRANLAARNPATLAKINQALEVEGVTFHGTLQARHLMDVLANDVGPEKIKPLIRRPLTGLKVAPYYGCQTVRPYSSFDDGQHPTSMIGILQALGVTIHHHLREATCCGTALLTTKPDVGFRMVGEILEESSPADCIVTICPMCHLNLDSYQDKASKVMGKPFSIPVLFLPQLIGLALGLPDDQLLLKRHVVPVTPMLTRLAA